jgi:hypothetical protein
MFIMMNAARLSVGLEGYAVAERAYQQAIDWARNRVQGKPPVSQHEGKPAPILYHPDVRRMLLLMRSQIEAMRALALYASYQLDLGADHPQDKQKEAARARGDLLIPIVKGWCTETGVEVASTGIQVHGGMGFIEETGAAQYYRDVRITTIYEGTTAIQANDLINRKLGRDGGAAMGALVEEMSRDLETLPQSGAALEAVHVLDTASRSLLALFRSKPEMAYAVSVPYLRLCGVVIGGWLLTKSSAIAAARKDFDPELAHSKGQSARFYADHVLPGALGLARIVEGGGSSVIEADPQLL